MKKHHAKKWLSDDRNNGAPPKEDLAWVNSNLQNDIATADWKFWAVVRPKSVTAQMNMDASMEKAKIDGLTVRAFSDPDEALNWLEAQ